MREPSLERRRLLQGTKRTHNHMRNGALTTNWSSGWPCSSSHFDKHKEKKEFSLSVGGGRRPTRHGLIGPHPSWASLLTRAHVPLGNKHRVNVFFDRYQWPVWVRWKNAVYGRLRLFCRAPYPACYSDRLVACGRRDSALYWRVSATRRCGRGPSSWAAEIEHEPSTASSDGSHICSATAQAMYSHAGSIQPGSVALRCCDTVEWLETHLAFYWVFGFKDA